MKDIAKHHRNTFTNQRESGFFKLKSTPPKAKASLAAVKTWKKISKDLIERERDFPAPHSYAITRYPEGNKIQWWLFNNIKSLLFLMSIDKLIQSLSEGTRPGCLENAPVSSVAGSGHCSDNREFQPILTIQMRLWSTNIVLWSKHSSANNGNCILRGSVVSRHFHVKLADCSIEGNIPVLFVHVMDAGSGLIS